MSKQNSIEGKYSIIIPIEDENGRIKFKLNSRDDVNGSTLADIATYSENMRNMYYSTKQKNYAVNSLMTGTLNYSIHGTMTPYYPDLTKFNINDLSQNDEPKLIGEACQELKDPI
ncbi:hypothetical protein RAT170B_1530 [Rickettsia argasii T170-B]|uniref:Uncharacterized protein n=2 Tax=Rickettsia argasii TaxID=1441385 RepID=A0A0F3RCI6_9RICK|nr:hypothetical protein RAT170B_1530 [Rickettsia argasii T170-B]